MSVYAIGDIHGGLKALIQVLNKVEVKEETALVDVYVIINYGNSIPDVAWKIQDNVKQAIEGMTGLNVKAVNVHVQGVNFPEDEQEEVENKEVEKAEDEE